MLAGADVRPVTHSLQGRLEDLPLPDIMQVVQSMAKTGALILERADGVRAISIFRNGRLVQAATDESYETLGDRLIRKKIITRRELDESLGYMAQFPGMRVGDALAEKGFASRRQIESECSAHLIETVRQLMDWRDAVFEFRVGQVSVVAESASLEMDFVLDDGVEPSQVLLRASILKDEQARVTHEPAAVGAAAARPGSGAEADEDGEVARAIESFAASGGPGLHDGQADAEASPPLQTLLRFSEELHAALTPGEARLLLLRYASLVYGHGSLVVRTGAHLSLFGGFGMGLPLADGGSGKGAGDSLLDAVITTRRPYMGWAFVTDEGRLVAAPRRTSGTFTVLCVPLLVLGEVRMILGCRQLIGEAPDVRALVAVARQAAVMFENFLLRKRATPSRTLPARAH